MGMCGILDDNQLTALRNLANPPHVRRVSGKMNRDYSPGSSINGTPESFGIEVHGTWVYVYKHGHSADLKNSACGSDKSIGRYNHFMTGTNVLDVKCSMKTHRSIGQCYAVLRSQVAGKELFKLFDLPVVPSPNPTPYNLEELPLFSRIEMRPAGKWVASDRWPTKFGQSAQFSSL